MYIAVAIISLLSLACYSWSAQKLINNSKYLSPSQKRINTLFNWILPFFWALLVRSTLTPSEIKVMTKKDRKFKLSSSNNHSIGDAAAVADFS